MENNEFRPGYPALQPPSARTIDHGQKANRATLSVLVGWYALSKSFHFSNGSKLRIKEPSAATRSALALSLLVALLLLACTQQPRRPRVGQPAIAAAQLDSSRKASRRTWRLDIDPRLNAQSLGAHLILAPDTEGGVTYAATSERGLVSGRLAPGGRALWSSVLQAGDDPIALCVMTSGAVAIAAGSTGRTGRMLTLLDASGRALWVQRFSTDHAAIEVLLATEERLFVVGTWRSDLMRPSGTLAAAAFDMQGRRVFGWELPCASALPPFLVDGHLALSLRVARKCQLPGGPEVAQGEYFVGYDADGKLLWEHEMKEVPAAAPAASPELSTVPSADPPAPSRAGLNCHPADLMCRMLAAAAKKAAASPRPVRPNVPSPRCNNNESVVVNQRGERLALLVPPRRPWDEAGVYRRARYALRDVDGIELWERDSLEVSAHLSMALGEDGSVFEAGVLEADDAAGRASDALYVAKTW